VATGTMPLAFIAEKGPAMCLPVSFNMLSTPMANELLLLCLVDLELCCTSSLGGTRSYRRVGASSSIKAVWVMNRVRRSKALFGAL
jgi:hypothetical protein